MLWERSIFRQGKYIYIYLLQAITLILIPAMESRLLFYFPSCSACNTEVLRGVKIQIKYGENRICFRHLKVGKLPIFKIEGMSTGGIKWENFSPPTCPKVVISSKTSYSHVEKGRKLTTPMSSCSVVREGAAPVRGKNHNIGTSSSISGEIFLMHL